MSSKIAQAFNEAFMARDVARLEEVVAMKEWRQLARSIDGTLAATRVLAVDGPSFLGVFPESKVDKLFREPLTTDVQLAFFKALVDAGAKPPECDVSLDHRPAKKALEEVGKLIADGSEEAFELAFRWHKNADFNMFAVDNRDHAVLHFATQIFSDHQNGYSVDRPVPGNRKDVAWRCVGMLLDEMKNADACVRNLLTTRSGPKHAGVANLVASSYVLSPAVDLLHKRGVKLDRPAGGGFQPLEVAYATGNQEAARALINTRAVVGGLGTVFKAEMYRALSSYPWIADLEQERKRLMAANTVNESITPRVGRSRKPAL